MAPLCQADLRVRRDQQDVGPFLDVPLLISGVKTIAELADGSPPFSILDSQAFQGVYV